jgi:hypothetical protein
LARPTQNEQIGPAADLMLLPSFIRHSESPRKFRRIARIRIGASSPPPRHAASSRVSSRRGNAATQHSGPWHSQSGRPEVPRLSSLSWFPETASKRIWPLVHELVADALDLRHPSARYEHDLRAWPAVTSSLPPRHLPECAFSRYLPPPGTHAETRVRGQARRGEERYV